MSCAKSAECDTFRRPAGAAARQGSRRRGPIVEVELGACRQCGNDAGDHSINGMCAPLSDPFIDRPSTAAVLPRQRAYAFINPDARPGSGPGR